jgi:hypothetical protein
MRVLIATMTAEKEKKRGSTIAWFVSPEKEVNQAMVETFSAEVG